MSGENTERKTALRFETVTAEGLVFESEPMPPVKGSSEPEREPSEKTFEKSEDVFTFGTDAKEAEGDGLTSFPEPPQMRKTYVPRFTEVSERYRTADGSRIPNRERVKSASAPKAAPELDPTAELDEERSVRKVVVNRGVSADDTFSDESIKIYKFEAGGAPAAPKIPEAGEHAQAPEPEEPKEQKTAEDTPDVRVYENTEDTEPAVDADAEILPSPVRRLAADEEPKGSHEGTHRSKSRLFPEYTSPLERDGFKDRFLDALMSVRVRFAAIALIILALIASEIIFLTVSPYDMGGFLAGGGALVDLLFSTALLALTLPEVARAVRYLSKRTAAPELMLPLSYLIILAYTLTAALGGEVGVRYMHFSLPFSLQAAFSVLASYFRLDGEFRSFKMISTGKPMWVLDKRFTRTLEKENMALDGAVDEYSSKLARVFRTSFVSDYSANTAKIRENTPNFLTLVGISLGASLITGAIALFLTDSPARPAAALEAFSMVFFFALPAFSLLVHKLPLARLLRMAKEEGHTFIGEGAVMDTAEVDVIAYDDTEIFGEEDVTIRRVHVYGRVYNTAKAIEEMYSLFSAVGGPLARVFAQSLDRKCSSAESVTLFDDGIVGFFEGHKIMAGSEEFMRRNNVKIPEDDYKTKPEPQDTVRVMYGAEDGEVYVKFFIKYSFMQEFSVLLPELVREHIVPLVYTRDPNIDAEMLRILTLGDDVIRVLKQRELPAADEVYPHISSTEVSIGEKYRVPEMLLTARAYRAHITLASVAELAVMLAGAALSSVLSLILMGRLSSVPAFMPALYQLLPGVLLFASASVSFKLRKKDKEK